jgi:hypothetical protein
VIRCAECDLAIVDNPRARGRVKESKQAHHARRWFQVHVGIGEKRLVVAERANNTSGINDSESVSDSECRQDVKKTVDRDRLLEGRWDKYRAKKRQA